MPRSWPLVIDGLTVEARLTPFKHTGIFPEQLPQWEWISNQCSMLNTQYSILNLFGYTGIASLFCAKAGAKVTHVDASRPTIEWAKRNQQLSGISSLPIRWILDDAVKFVAREARRGNKYDGIIMDPPIFGHGLKGEMWKFNESLPKLLQEISQVLSENIKFIVINAYAVSTSSVTLGNVLSDLTQKLGGQIETGEHVIAQENSDRVLSTGIWGRWSK